MEDQSYISTGKPESWTHNGLKVYDYQWYFNGDKEFIETFFTEDGLCWENTIPKFEWTEEIKNLAKEKGILK